MVDDADGNLLVSLDVLQQRCIACLIAAAFEHQDIAVHREEIGQRACVARPVPVEALLVRIAPAGMRPDLGVDALDLAVECGGVKLKVAVTARWLCVAVEMMHRLLDLDDGTARRREFPVLFVQSCGNVHDERAIILVVLIPEHYRQAGRTDRTKLDRMPAHLLGGLPDRGEMQRPTRDPAGHRWRMIGLLDFIEDVPRFQVAVVEEMRRTAETRDTVEALYDVKEPGSPADL